MHDGPKVANYLVTTPHGVTSLHRLAEVACHGWLVAVCNQKPGDKLQVMLLSARVGGRFVLAPRASSARECSPMHPPVVITVVKQHQKGLVPRQCAPLVKFGRVPIEAVHALDHAIVVGIDTQQLPDLKPLKGF